MKKKLVWLVVICLMMVVPLVACGSKTGENEPPPTTTPGNKTPAVLPTLKIGETAKGSDVQVTVLEANVADSYEYFSSSLNQTITKEASSDKSFLIINASVKNISNLTTRSGGGFFTVVDSTGYEYHLMPYYGASAMPSDMYLIPGAELEGKALFQIPRGAVGLKVVYAGTGEWTIN